MGNWFKDLILGNTIDESKTPPQVLNEQIETFRPKRQRATEKRSRQGEGMEDMDFILSGNYSNLGFNSFYRTYVNKTYEDEVARIKAYREMAQYPEIADVIEDAAMESTQEDYEGRVIYLEVLNEKLSKNENAMKNIRDEFNELFHRNIRIKWEIYNLMYNYFVDGKVYWERVIDTSRPKKGIINLKRLPAETMDFMYDPVNGAITAYFQYLTTKPRQLPTIEDAMKDPNVVVFYPDQISLVHYGYKGATKREFLGYLEKAKQPYNNLRLLETSVVIYRLIRAPERFVFKIDTGNMPKDKAMKYVDKIKTAFQKKQTYDAQSGNLTNEPDMFSILENFFLPQSADGRGSDVTSVGGNPSGFAELDDLYYFQKKLYKALKYPMSRVSSLQERAEKDILFNNGQMGEITRDEIKWAKFLERQQMRFCDEFLRMFLVHLDLKGLKQQYDLDEDSMRIVMTSPNQYRDHMRQGLLDTNFNNYNALAANEEFSKYYLMKKYLGWDDDEIKANSEGFKMDKKLLPDDAGSNMF